MGNHEIARRLTEHARKLASEGENVFRIRAYRQAAQTVAWLDRPLSEVYASSGKSGLEKLPGIGQHLAWTLEGLLQTGEFHTYDKRPRTARRVARAG